MSRSWLNPDFVSVTLHSYQSRWEEAEPDPRSKELEQKIKNSRQLAHSSLFIQGKEDRVNPPETGETMADKFSGYFPRVIIPGVGHFPSRENPEGVARHLLEFLEVTSRD